MIGASPVRQVDTDATRQLAGHPVGIILVPHGDREAGPLGATVSIVQFSGLPSVPTERSSFTDGALFGTSRFSTHDMIARLSHPRATLG